jgi:hypothetical protein
MTRPVIAIRFLLVQESRFGAASSFDGRLVSEA